MFYTFTVHKFAIEVEFATLWNDTVLNLLTMSRMKIAWFKLTRKMELKLTYLKIYKNKINVIFDTSFHVFLSYFCMGYSSSSDRDQSKS